MGFKKIHILKMDLRRNFVLANENKTFMFYLELMPNGNSIQKFYRKKNNFYNWI
jgi:hypothetical protein